MLEISWTRIPGFALGWISRGEDSKHSHLRCLGCWNGKNTFPHLTLFIYMPLHVHSLAFLSGWINQHEKFFYSQGDTRKLPYPGWTMGIALCLIILGILPILIAWLMNVYNILGPSGRPRSASTTMRRIDTAASTRPMMEDYEVRFGSDRPWYRRWF